jgi:hypothetical protein
VSQLSHPPIPRALPFAPPPELVAREARLRRWTFYLVGGAALGLVLLSSASVFLLHYFQWKGGKGSGETGASREGTLSPSMPAVRIKPAWKSFDSRAEDGFSAEADRPRRRGGKALEGRPVKPAERPAAHEQLLQSLAVLTVGHLYQGYLNIGFLADNMGSDVYSRDEAVKMLKEVTNTLSIVDRQLARLRAVQLTPEDRRDVEHVRQLGKLLRAQADELTAYWEEPTKAQALRYKKARAAAWAGIKPLLGIDQE